MTSAKVEEVLYHKCHTLLCIYSNFAVFCSELLDISTKSIIFAENYLKKRNNGKEQTSK